MEELLRTEQEKLGDYPLDTDTTLEKFRFADSKQCSHTCAVQLIEDGVLSHCLDDAAIYVVCRGAEADKLSRAEQKSQIELLRLLIARGADVNAYARYYCPTPLVIARVRNATDVVSFIEKEERSNKGLS